MNRTLYDPSNSIVALDTFIQATRDAGYKNTASAVAELVDNSIQARARRISVTVGYADPDDSNSIEIAVQDDGCGMDPVTVRHALRFGGSTRFNDRHGMGRFGMGLPNSSLSQARRVTVLTWQSPNSVSSSYLDVDMIAAGAMVEVPEPEQMPWRLPFDPSPSGTIIQWSRCDRLDHKRISTIVRKLLADLGRRFRWFIWDGVTISVNGDKVEPIDPLYLRPEAKVAGAQRFGEPIEYEVRADMVNGGTMTGTVRVTFSELPVHDWQGLPNKEKRRLGISKGAGVSVVRAGREVDHGWFFLPTKRRENYDDWWRCEIQFEPVLDEAFGVTHTKQQIRPKQYLVEALSPDIEAAARALNARARKAHLAAKAACRFSQAEKLASEQEQLLEPLPSDSRERDRAILRDLKKDHVPVPTPATEDRDVANLGLEYRIVESAVRDMSFFTYARAGKTLVLVLNPHHPFYKQVYKPLAESDGAMEVRLRTLLELVLLAAARSEAAEVDPHESAVLEQQRLLWSNTLATFLNGNR